MKDTVFSMIDRITTHLNFLWLEYEANPTESLAKEINEETHKVQRLAGLCRDEVNKMLHGFSFPR